MREIFLERIRQAAAAGRFHRSPPEGTPDPNAGYMGAGPDILDRLAEELGRAGAFPHRAGGAASAVERLCDLARQKAVRRAVRWSHPTLDRLGLEGALNDLGVEVVTWDQVTEEARDSREGAWDRVFSADLGISAVDYAVAETGTMVVASLPGQGRSVSLLPPVHVAFVEPRRVVPDLFDLFQRLGEGVDVLPGNITMITGPSKTGDIELRLTTGVHGPGEVHVILLDRDLT